MITDPFYTYLRIQFNRCHTFCDICFCLCVTCITLPEYNLYYPGPHNAAVNWPCIYLLYVSQCLVYISICMSVYVRLSWIMQIILTHAMWCMWHTDRQTNIKKMYPYVYTKNFRYSEPLPGCNSAALGLQVHFISLPTGNKNSVGVGSKSRHDEFCVYTIWMTRV